MTKKRHLRYGGAAVLRPGEKAQPGKARQERERVLVIVEHDGFISVFGDRERLQVHIAHRLACPLQDTKQRLIAEAILEARLPPQFRELFLPANRLATGDVRECLPPDEEVARLEAMSWLKELGEWQTRWTAQ